MRDGGWTLDAGRNWNTAASTTKSDGSGTPYRVRIRPPCFQITGGLYRILEGRMLSDIVPTFGALNMIGGECDH